MILDIDGTLLDSNDAHAQAWVDTFAEHGHEVAFDEVRKRIGKGGDKLVWELVKVKDGLPEGEAMSKRRAQIFKKQYLPSLRPTRGARELLLRMKERGLQLVVATSAKREELAPLLETADVADLIEAEVTSDDAERSKPDPDIVAAAVARSGRAPHELVMLGDTPYDIEAARKAGLRTIALRSGGWDDEGLRGAAAIYEDPAELLRRWDESPLASSTGATE